MNPISESVAKRLIMSRIKQRISAELYEEVEEVTNDKLFCKDIIRFFGVLYSLEDDAPEKKPAIYLGVHLNPIHFEFFELLDGFYFSINWMHPVKEGSHDYYEITRIPNE